MKSDEHGRVSWTPREFFGLAEDDPKRLINDYLLRATPAAFPSYENYCSFLDVISGRLGVPPQHLVLRGSCQIGFSTTPSDAKLWQAFDDDSDLDLAIIDAEYHDLIEHRIVDWERRNRAGEPVGQPSREFHQGTVPGRASKRFLGRQEDRFYNCCRVDDDDLPWHLCGHHRDTMLAVASMKFSGPYRNLNAFIYRDWWSIRSRYESDLKKVCQGVNGSARVLLPEPGERPLPRTRRR